MEKRKYGSIQGTCPECGEEGSLGWKTGICRKCYRKKYPSYAVEEDEPQKLGRGERYCDKCGRAHRHNGPVCVDCIVHEKRRLYEGIYARIK